MVSELGLLFFNMLSIKSFPLYIDLFLSINVGHLVFQIVLDFLVFAELLDLLSFGFPLVLALIVLDNSRPETVLFLLYK